MKTFQAFITERDTGGLGDLAPDNSSGNESLYRLARLAVDEFPHETINLLRKLSKRNTEIRSELERYERSKKGAGFANDERFRMNYERDKDTVVPNSADSVSSEMG